MKKKNRLLIAFLIALMGCNNSPKTIQLGESSNQDVINAMTLEEKALLLVGDDAGFPRGYPSGFGGADTLFSSQPPAVGKTEREVPGAAGTTYPIPRLGIPAIVLADGPAGVRIDPTRPDTSKTFYATAFPIESLLACTWNTDLVTNVGKAMGTEALEYGVDILLAPALNIHRNPLGGRNFEYYSEDPVVSGEMAAAMVNGVQSVGVGTSIKHFAVNNNETNRMSINAVIDDTTLHELYLKGFEIAVKKSQPWTVMSAYNKINGVYCSENPVLLDSILRQQWGFQGLVMTDWFAGRNRIDQVKAGNDLLMPGSKYIATQIVKAVNDGVLDEKEVDRNVNNILNVIKKTPKFKKYPYSNNPDLDSHAKQSKMAAIEGMVLLKNNAGVLPFSNVVKSIAAFGLGTYNTIAVGTGSGNVNMAYSISIKDGLEKMGYKIPDEMIEASREHKKAEEERVGQKKSYFDPDIMLEEKQWSIAELKELAKTNDIALYTISRTSGEFADRKVKNDFALTSVEAKMLKQVADVFHAYNKKIVVVLNIGGVIETDSWKGLADAILLAWQPGQEAGYAIAEVLSGKENPSGKLSMTFPVNFNDLPSSAYFPNPELNPSEVYYNEKENVGYRYFVAEDIKPSYEFGYGLSYTTFDYDNLKIEKDGNDYKVDFSITNNGNMAGKEVAELYLSNENAVTKITLKSFSKTKLLEPGESVNVSMKLSSDDFKQYASAKKGNYKIFIGASSSDIKLTDVVYYE